MGNLDDLWDAMHEVRERVTRIEERSLNRDEKIAGMASKVDELHKFFTQAEGGAQVASTMAKLAYGVGGAIFVFIASNWQAFKRIWN